MEARRIAAAALAFGIFLAAPSAAGGFGAAAEAELWDGGSATRVRTDPLAELAEHGTVGEDLAANARSVSDGADVVAGASVEGTTPGTSVSGRPFERGSAGGAFASDVAGASAGFAFEANLTAPGL